MLLQWKLWSIYVTLNCIVYNSLKLYSLFDIQVVFYKTITSWQILLVSLKYLFQPYSFQQLSYNKYRCSLQIMSEICYWSCTQPMKCQKYVIDLVFNQSNVRQLNYHLYCCLFVFSWEPQFCPYEHLWHDL